MTQPAEQPTPSPSPITAREWDLPWKGAFLYALSLRPIVSRAARQAGISRQYAYEAAGNDPEFAAAWKEALAVGSELLEEVIWQRATTGEQRATTKTTRRGIVDRTTGEIRGEQVVETTTEETVHVSDTLAMFMMKKLNPAFREKSDIVVTGPGGGPVQHEHEVFRRPTQERMLELVQIAAELSLPVVDATEEIGSGNGASA